MRVEMAPYSLDPEEQHHVANLCSALMADEPSIRISRFDRAFPVRRSPADVIHVHWPEHVLQNRGLARYGRPVRQLGSLWWCRRRGSAVVHTAHNAAPHDHDLTRFDRWYLRSFDRLVDTVLVSSPSIVEELLHERPGLRRASLEMVHLGLPLSPVPDAIDDVGARRSLGFTSDLPIVAFVGRIMRYKGVPSLIDVWEPSTAGLLIAGEPADAELARELEQRLSCVPGAVVVLRRLGEEELVTMVAAASVIVLPFLRILNSGSALLALSLGRRVLVPDLPTFRDLRGELGETWVHLFAGSRPTRDDIDRALVNLPSGRPDLTKHEWSTVSVLTLAAYRRTLQRLEGTK